jgi:hypothetical protein
MTIRVIRRQSPPRTHEFVDGTGWRPEFQDTPTGINPTGPYLALDPSGSPTLSWMWKRDDWQPGDFDLYFAWKMP